MTSKGVMQASLTTVAVAPAAAAPAKLVSATVSPNPFFAASYTAKCTACAGLQSKSAPSVRTLYALDCRAIPLAPGLSFFAALYTAKCTACAGLQGKKGTATP